MRLQLIHNSQTIQSLRQLITRAVSQEQDHLLDYWCLVGDTKYCCWCNVIAILVFKKSQFIKLTKGCSRKKGVEGWNGTLKWGYHQHNFIFFMVQSIWIIPPMPFFLNSPTQEIKKGNNLAKALVGGLLYDNIVRCPADFMRIFRCNGEFIYIKICHYSSKETRC